MPALFTVAVVCCAVLVGAQYTLLSKDGLIEVPDITNRFGPEDKLVRIARCHSLEQVAVP